MTIFNGASLFSSPPASGIGIQPPGIGGFSSGGDKSETLTEALELGSTITLDEMRSPDELCKEEEKKIKR